MWCIIEVCGVGSQTPRVQTTVLPVTMCLPRQSVLPLWGLRVYSSLRGVVRINQLSVSVSLTVRYHCHKKQSEFHSGKHGVTGTGLTLPPDTEKMDQPYEAKVFKTLDPRATNLSDPWETGNKMSPITAPLFFLGRVSRLQCRRGDPRPSRGVSLS